MFATGVTVITTRVGEQVHGMTANAFMSVSLRPPLVLISVDRRAKLNALLREGAHFGVSVLEERQTALSDRFAGRPRDDDAGAAFEIVRDTPLVEGALAHLVARVVRCYWGGDHSLFLGQVEYVRYGEGTPLLFHGGRYERVVRDPHVFSELPTELLEPLIAAGVERSLRGRRAPDGERASRATRCISCSRARCGSSGRGRSCGSGRASWSARSRSSTRGRAARDVIAEGPVRASRSRRTTSARRSRLSPRPRWRCSASSPAGSARRPRVRPLARPDLHVERRVRRKV